MRLELTWLTDQEQADVIRLGCLTTVRRRAFAGDAAAWSRACCPAAIAAGGGAPPWEDAAITPALPRCGFQRDEAGVTGS